MSNYNRTPGENGIGCDVTSYAYGARKDAPPDFDDRYALDGSDLYIAPLSEQIAYLEQRIALLQSKENAGSICSEDIDAQVLLEADLIISREQQRLAEYHASDPKFTREITAWVAAEKSQKKHESPESDDNVLQVEVIEALVLEICEDYNIETLSDEDEADLRCLLDILQTQKLEAVARMDKAELERLYALAA